MLGGSSYRTFEILIANLSSTMHIATCLAYYVFFLDRQFRGDVAILVFLKTMASYNPTSLTPSLFTEVPVLCQESEWSCICVLGISHFPISTIFLLNLWNFSHDVILFFILL